MKRYIGPIPIVRWLHLKQDLGEKFSLREIHRGYHEIFGDTVEQSVQLTFERFVSIDVQRVRKIQGFKPIRWIHFGELQAGTLY